MCPRNESDLGHTQKTNILINHGNQHLQNQLFYTDRLIKRKLISTAIPTLLPHNQISASRKISEVRAKQKEKEDVKL